MTIAYIYIAGVVILFLIHFSGGNLRGTATVTLTWFAPPRKFRIPAVAGATILTLLWPIILPIQIWNNRP